MSRLFDKTRAVLWNRTYQAHAKRPSGRLRLGLTSPLLASLVLGWVGCSREDPAPALSNYYPSTSETAARAAQIEAKEHQIDQTVWAKEMLAEECGRTLEALWDSINAASNKLAVLGAFPMREMILGKWESVQTLPHGIMLRGSAGQGPTLAPDQWPPWVLSFERAGWQLSTVEFRHHQFDTDEAGRPAQSLYYFEAHLTNSINLERAQVGGELTVDWAKSELTNSVGSRTAQEDPPPRQQNEMAVRHTVARVDASRLTIKTRAGAPPFQPLLTERLLPLRNSRSIDPLILYDLDGDGHSEIILAARNLLYRRGSDGRYSSQPLCRYPPDVVYVALIADFDGDGIADYLCETFEGLILFKGSPQGSFEEPGRLVWRAPHDVKYPMVLTCGDVDQDGDLDVFLAQYKYPYEGGQMPTPYYDANDGYPSFLLLNDGQGNFSDGTSAAGLEKKRWRRTYSASLVDLQGRGILDLVVVSDFAGIDVYKNDGRGRFTDVTSQWIPEAHAFGMADAFSDFNADGRLDLLMIGMPSPTADRLEHLQLWRPDAREDRTMRLRMTRGCRLYLASHDGGFEESVMAKSLAHAGWGWGCGAFDFDNDGYPDLFIANSMESRKLVRDYEGEFWLHDSYVATSAEDLAVYRYLKSKVKRMRSHGESYGGYEKNRFYLNQAGHSFLEAAHLLGVGLEQDSRNVVADDLDGDGRGDLIVTGYDLWPRPTQWLLVYRNELGDCGNWIGFLFREEGRGKSPVGLRAVLHYGGQSSVRTIVTGDSYRSQQPNTVHFGLGSTKTVDSVEIHWIDGQAVTLQNPAVNRYHWVHPPRK